MIILNPSEKLEHVGTRHALSLRELPSTLSLRLFVILHGNTATDQIPVAIGRINSSDGWPEFIRFYKRYRIYRLFSSVSMIPSVRQGHSGGMRRVFQHVVGFVCRTVFDFPDFFADRDQSIAEPVQLAQIFRLRRLNHQGTRYGERDRRGMEAIIHQTLG